MTNSEVCCACLSRDRKLSSLDNLRCFFDHLVHEGKADTRSRGKVCWECNSILNKCVKFKKRAQQAQALLSVASSPLESEIATMSETHTRESFSNLNVTSKCDFDKTYIFKEVPETEGNVILSELMPIKDEHFVNVVENQYDSDVQDNHEMTITYETNKEVKTVLKTLQPIVLGDSDKAKDTTPKLGDPMTKSAEGMKWGPIKATKLIMIKVGNVITRLPIFKKGELAQIKESPSPPIALVSRPVRKVRKLLKKPKLKGKLTKKKEVVGPLKKKQSSIEDMYIHIPKDKLHTLIVSEEEMLAAREEEKQKALYVNLPFKCKSCIVSYYTEDQLKDHNLAKHRKRPGWTRCNVCEIYSTESIAKAHRLRHYIRYKCRECNFSHHILRAAWRHLSTAHRPRAIASDSFPCKSCSEVFPSMNKRRYHNQKYHKKPAKCEVCDKVFTAQGSLKIHMDSMHSIGKTQDQVQCEICHKMYRNKKSLQGHIWKNHSGDTKQYHCTLCNADFKHVYNYRQHLRISQNHVRPELLKLTDHSTDTKQYHCTLCNANFKHVFNYRQHLRNNKNHVRPEQLKHTCQVCSKKFMTENQMKKHFDYHHVGKTEFICGVCDKSISSASGLRRHKRFVHDREERVRDKVCEVCGKAFYTRKTLTLHRYIHTGERPYPCEICGATFRQTASRDTHRKLVHLGIKRNRSAPKN